MAKVWTKVKIAALALRSETVNLQPSDRLTGRAFMAWTSTVGSRELSIEIWDLSELRVQSKSIPNGEAVNDSALLYMKRGSVDSGFSLGDLLVEKSSSNAGVTKSLRVVSVLAFQTDTIDVEIWIEIDRL